MKDTSRRNFLTGLTTASVALPIVASNPIEKTKHQETWDDVKVGMRYAISGYMLCHAYEDLTEEKLNEIELTVSRMLEEIRVRDIIHDYRVVASSSDGELKVKVGFKKKPGVEFTIWDFIVYSHNKEMS